MSVCLWKQSHVKDQGSTSVSLLPNASLIKLCSAPISFKHIVWARNSMSLLGHDAEVDKFICFFQEARLLKNLVSATQYTVLWDGQHEPSDGGLIEWLKDVMKMLSPRYIPVGQVLGIHPQPIVIFLADFQQAPCHAHHSGQQSHTTLESRQQQSYW